MAHGINNLAFDRQLTPSVEMTIQQSFLLSPQPWCSSARSTTRAAFSASPASATRTQSSGCVRADPAHNGCAQRVRGPGHPLRSAAAAAPQAVRVHGCSILGLRNAAWTQNQCGNPSAFAAAPSTRHTTRELGLSASSCPGGDARRSTLIICSSSAGR